MFQCPLDIEPSGALIHALKEERDEFDKFIQNTKVVDTL